MPAVLGFDTSCYTTSAAVIAEDGQVIAFSRKLLPVEAGQCGLRQSEAVFAHIKQMPTVMENLRSQLNQVSGTKLCAVCASRTPRNTENSYMPVFSVGLSHAKAVAAALGVPCYETDHQSGHIAAGTIGNPTMPARFTALHLSGGTTELLNVNGSQISQIGGSMDLHAGQMVDRVGVRLGLPFPSGPHLEALAMKCSESTTALLPCNMENEDLYCHFSGAETKVYQLLQSKTYTSERLAAEVYDLLARTVARLLIAGCSTNGTDAALVVGGVSSSALFRKLLTERLRKSRAGFKVFFGNPEYSGDNAAGVALIGLRMWQKEHGKM